MKPEYFECECHSDEHTLKFTLDTDDNQLYTSVFLDYPYPLWRRLWTGIKYIFGYKCKYGHFDCFILKAGDAERLAGLLAKITNPQAPTQT